MQKLLQVALKSHPLKKKKNSIASVSNEYVINIMGELMRLKKGMSKEDVMSILGEPVKIESCTNPVNEKLVFKINNGKPVSTRYSVLFTNEQLVYVAKLN